MAGTLVPRIGEPIQCQKKIYVSYIVSVSSGLNFIMNYAISFVRDYDCLSVSDAESSA